MLLCTLHTSSTQIFLITLSKTGKKTANIIQTGQSRNKQTQSDRGYVSNFGLAEWNFRTSHYEHTVSSFTIKSF